MHQETHSDEAQVDGSETSANGPATGAPEAPEAMVLDAEHSISAREPERRSLADDVERFLQTGGEIQSVPKDFRADPPKKPENNYGRGSI